MSDEKDTGKFMSLLNSRLTVAKLLIALLAVGFPVTVFFYLLPDRVDAIEALGVEHDERISANERAIEDLEDHVDEEFENLEKHIDAKFSVLNNQLHNMRCFLEYSLDDDRAKLQSCELDDI